MVRVLFSGQPVSLKSTGSLLGPVSPAAVNDEITTGFNCITRSLASNVQPLSIILPAIFKVPVGIAGDVTTAAFEFVVNAEINRQEPIVIFLFHTSSY